MPTINPSFQVPLPGQQMAQPNYSGVPDSFMGAYKMAAQQADPLERLKRLSLEQGLQMQGFNLQKALEDRQKQVDGEAMARELAPKIQSFIKAGDPMAAKNEMLGLTAMHHELVNSPYWNSLGKSVDDSIGFANEKIKFQAELEMRQAQKKLYENRSITGANLSPPERRAQAVVRADEQVREAESTGDPVLIENAIKYRDALNAAIKSEHRDPVETTQLTLIRQRIAELNAQRGNLTQKWRLPEIEAEMKSLQSQLDNWGKTPTQPTAGGTEKIINGFKVRMK